MDSIKFTELENRRLLRIAGTDAISFLHGLFTCDVENIAVGNINFGALLTPQGKILFDFFIIRLTEAFLIDIDKSMADDFTRRLIFYRLRADVKIESMDQRTHVFAAWKNGIEKLEKMTVDGIYGYDPRLARLGYRAYIRRAPQGVKIVPKSEYDQMRLKLGMPVGGKDFSFGDAFPHEALMDQFEGVNFSKGCYIGQEVVSRVQHRGTARKRIVLVSAETELPSIGTEILANGRVIGNLSSCTGKTGLALVRIDKVGSVLNDNGTIHAGTLPVELSLQDWVNYNWQ